jgi:hypothetical protein
MPVEYGVPFSVLDPLMCEPPEDVKLTIPAHLVGPDLIGFGSYSSAKADHEQFFRRMPGPFDL